MTKEYTIKCFILSGILFIYSCAAIQAPPGGPKDIIPPKLVHAVPANGSIYFTGGRVELVFSEYLQENSVHNAIRIQPSLPEPLGIKYKGRTLWVDFPDSLIENQTYIISINRDLRDEHGVQLGQGLQIAYATGSEIDRGEINGKVYYDKPVALHLWMVNSESDLTQFYTSPPDYVTDADNEGNYSFYHLSPGSYRLIGVDRSSAGLSLDPERMIYGLSWRNIVQLDSNQVKDGINMRIAERPRKIKLIRGEWLGRYWGKLFFSDNISNYEKLLSVHVIKDSSILIPTTFLDMLDKKVLHFILPDSLPGDSRLTITIPAISQGERTLIDSGRVTVRASSESDTSYLDIINPKNGFEIKPEEDRVVPLDIFFSRIMKDSVNEDTIHLLSDTIAIPFSSQWLSPLHLQIVPKENWITRSKFSLVIMRDRIFPFFGRSLQDSIKTIQISTTNFIGFGNLVGRIEKPYPQPLVAELVPFENEQSKQSTVVNSNSEFEISHVSEGKYSLLIFNDLDGVRNYSYGQIDPFQPAEWFRVLPDTITIRNNWDMEITDIRLEQLP